MPSSMGTVSTTKSRKTVVLPMPTGPASACCGKPTFGVHKSCMGCGAPEQAAKSAARRNRIR